MYSEIPDRDDFIDLHVAVRNIVNELDRIIDSNHDCFLFTHQGKNLTSTLKPGEDSDNQICSTCKINGGFTNNYQTRRTPKGEFTISCNYDCPYGKYICCTECFDKDDCMCACDSCPDSCNNVHTRL